MTGSCPGFGTATLLCLSGLVDSSLLVLQPDDVDVTASVYGHLSPESNLEAPLSQPRPLLVA